MSIPNRVAEITRQREGIHTALEEFLDRRSKSRKRMIAMGKNSDGYAARMDAHLSQVSEAYGAALAHLEIARDVLLEAGGEHSADLAN
ncbi:MAG: hypothetical protein ACREQI_01015 [Candidatus Binataceae bacterium]